jgi:hypothetical protein
VRAVTAFHHWRSSATTTTKPDSREHVIRRLAAHHRDDARQEAVLRRNVFSEDCAFRTATCAAPARSSALKRCKPDSANPRPRAELPRRSRAITCRVISSAATSLSWSGPDMAETTSAMIASLRSPCGSAIRASARKKSRNRIGVFTFRSESGPAVAGVRRG